MQTLWSQNEQAELIIEHLAEVVNRTKSSVLNIEHPNLSHLIQRVNISDVPRPLQPMPAPVRLNMPMQTTNIQPYLTALCTAVNDNF